MQWAIMVQNVMEPHITLAWAILLAVLVVELVAWAGLEAIGDPPAWVAAL